MTEQTQVSLAELKEQAKALDITFSPNIGAAKLQAKIDAVLNAASETPTPKPVDEIKMVNPEILAQRNARLRKEANALVRVQVTNMNPRTQHLEGMYYEAGNALVGQVKRFVQYNVPWHVERIVLEFMKTKQCQVFVSVTKKNGDTVRQGKLIDELSIQELPYLTPTEIKALAQRQAMANGTSEV